MHNGIRRAAAVALAVSALTLATACNSGSDDKEASATTGSASAAESPSPAPAEPLSSGAAEKALIAESDLPAGWKLSDGYVLDGTGTLSSDELLPKATDATCQPLVNLFNTGRIDIDHKSTAQIVFHKGDSQLGQDVTGYSADQAERATAALKKAVTGCKAFDTKYAGGTAKVTIKPLTVTEPATADESVGLSLQLTYGDDMVVDIEYGIVREGATVVNVQNNWMDDRGIEAFKNGLAKAAAKLHAQTTAA